MMEKTNTNSTSANIENLTLAGDKALKACNLKKALECFELAYKSAQQQNDAQLIRVCAFNLGAVYIADREPSKGIRLLETAVPPATTSDGHSNGDLFYNFGLGYELLGNKQEAVKYLELSLEEYHNDKNNQQMAAQVATKSGTLYSALNSPLQAARAHGIASAVYKKLPDLSSHALCLCQQANALFKANRVKDTVRLADECIIVCQNVTESESLGKLYNELGLLYSQCSDFPRAQSCFELALPLSRGPKGDKKQQAVILQNLGAVYNSLGDYQRSLGFHESAATLHAELQNRSAQGQCFTNLAFAHSRLGDTEGAGECYLHALQAAKDTNDKHAQWQAMEGLGAVAFHVGAVDRAVRYYQMALSTLSSSPENNPTAHDRLLSKMRDALQHQITLEQKGSGQGSVSPLAILTNDLGRPPSRQEIEMLRQFKKVPYEFDRVALGLGGYESNDDMSFLKNHRRSTRRSRWSEEGRPRPGRSRSLDSRDEVDRNGKQISMKKTDNKSVDQKRKLNQLARRFSTRRQSSPGKAEGPGRRQAYLDPLLRPEGYDSEEEWKKKHKSRRGHHSVSDFFSVDSDSNPEADEYEPGRVRPPDTPENSDGERATNGNKRGKPARQRSETDTEEEIRRRVRREQEEEENRRRSLQSISVQRPHRGRVETETESEVQLEESGSSRPESGSRSRPESRSRSRPESRSRSRPESGSRSRPESGSRSQPETGSRSSERRLSRSSNEDLNDTDRYLSRYHEELLQRQETETAEETSETLTEDASSSSSSGSEEETETERENGAIRTGSLGPPDVTAPRPPGGVHPQLNSTYEKPIDYLPENLEGGVSKKGLKNFFKAHSGISEGQGHLGQGDHEGHVRRDGSTNLKLTIPDPNDPDYQTIRSLGRTQPPVAGPSTEDRDVPPELPPRNVQFLDGQLDGLSRAEQEEFLQNYNRLRQSHSRENMGRPQGNEDENGVEIPQRKKNRNTSRACVVM